MWRDAKMISELLNSAATFRKGTFSKVGFVLQNQIDLVLTYIALSCGLAELNPFVMTIMQSPLRTLTIKSVIPALIVWLTPGKLLIPASILLSLVIGWDLKELFFSLPMALILFSSLP